MTTPWFRWFAWRPVWTYDRGWVWLRKVWKRHVPPPDVPGACWTWECRVTRMKAGRSIRVWLDGEELTK